MAVATYPFLESIVVLILGLVLGSFATAVAHREVKGEVWFTLWGRGQDVWSKCPACNARLKFLDLIPVFSWLFSKGQCRYCGVKVGARYPLIEILSAVFCLGLYWAGGFTVSTFILIALIPFLMALFFIDLDVLLLPNRLVAICFAISGLWVGWSYFQNDDAAFLIDHIGGGFILPALFFGTAFIVGCVLKKEAIGMGDIKFLAPAGLLVGLSSIPAYLILSGVLGVLSFVVIHFKGQVKGRVKNAPQAFAFGPALIAALYLIVVYKAYIFQ